MGAVVQIYLQVIKGLLTLAVPLDGSLLLAHIFT